jgi:hypothetical protein
MRRGMGSEKSVSVHAKVIKTVHAGTSYSNVDDMLEGYKIKSAALPFKIFSTYF